jgi:hypothetical protein
MAMMSDMLSTMPAANVGKAMTMGNSRYQRFDARIVVKLAASLKQVELN